jgi:hypothetical protein
LDSGSTEEEESPKTLLLFLGLLEAADEGITILLTIGTNYHLTWRNISEELILHRQACVKFNSCLHSVSV